MTCEQAFSVTINPLRSACRTNPGDTVGTIQVVINQDMELERRCSLQAEPYEGFVRLFGEMSISIKQKRRLWG